jgi:hypothetical protein
MMRPLTIEQQLEVARELHKFAREDCTVYRRQIAYLGNAIQAMLVALLHENTTNAYRIGLRAINADLDSLPPPV